MSRQRTIIRLSVVLAALALVWACGGDSPIAPPTPEPAHPTTVTVSPATAQLPALGLTVQLTAEVRDQNARVMAGATVTWTSSANSVATVDASGLVTAAGNGTATITATAGGVSGTATMTVTQSVASVEVSPVEAELSALGATVQLTAEAFDANGHAVAEAEFSWASGDSSVATVGARGPGDGGRRRDGDDHRDIERGVGDGDRDGGPRSWRGRDLSPPPTHWLWATPCAWRP